MGLGRSRTPKRPTAPSGDHTLWMSVVIEILAVVAAVAFAYQHAAS